MVAGGDSSSLARFIGLLAADSQIRRMPDGKPFAFECARGGFLPLPGEKPTNSRLMASEKPANFVRFPGKVRRSYCRLIANFSAASAGQVQLSH